MRLNVNILVAVEVEVMLDYPGECCWRQPQLTVPAGVGVKVILLIVAVPDLHVLNCLDSLRGEGCPKMNHSGGTLDWWNIWLKPSCTFLMQLPCTLYLPGHDHCVPLLRYQLDSSKAHELKFQ